MVLYIKEVYPFFKRSFVKNQDNGFTRDFYFIDFLYLNEKNVIQASHSYVNPEIFDACLIPVDLSMISSYPLKVRGHYQDYKFHIDELVLDK